MRYLVLIIICLLLFSCDFKNKSGADSQKSPILPGYDSIKFNHYLIPDTSGYSWITEKRIITDTLFFAKAVVVKASDTFLSLPKYKRLWSCPIPSNILLSNDTVLISGFVYNILPSNGGKGFPIIINKLLYSSK